MNKIDKYLRRFAYKIVTSESKQSRYYTIGELIVRVSDHIGRNSDGDISIIIDRENYILYVPTTNKVSLIPYEDCKALIKGIVLHTSLFLTGDPQFQKSLIEENRALEMQVQTLKRELNVLLAKLEQGASQFKALLRDYTTFFKKESDNFRGVKNTYEPRPDTVDLPSERKLIAVVTTVDEKFDYFTNMVKSYISEMFNCEATNASGTARADLVVDGNVIANLSSLELLKLKSFLENPQLQEMFQNIPVRKDSEIWEPCTEEMYAGRAIMQSPLLKGTKKSITKTQYILEDPNVQKLGSATHYQPQIAVKDTVMELGDYTMQRFSGEWTPRQRALALQRRSTLLSATIAALKVANEVEAVKSNLDSEWLLNYLQGR